MKLVGLIKMCSNETYSKVCIGKNLSATFHTQNGVKLGGQGSSRTVGPWRGGGRRRNGLKQDDLLPLLFNFALES